MALHNQQILSDGGRVRVRIAEHDIPLCAADDETSYRGSLTAGVDLQEVFDTLLVRAPPLDGSSRVARLDVELGVDGSVRVFALELGEQGSLALPELFASFTLALPEALPRLRPITLRRLRFDASESRLRVAGLLGRAELALEAGGGEQPTLRFLYASTNEPLSLGELLGSKLAQGLAEAIPGELFAKLGASGLARVDLDVDAEAGALSLGAAGQILGLGGELWLSVVTLDGVRGSFRVVTNDPPKSLAERLRGLGFDLDPALERVLPQLQIGCEELAFDQFTSSLRIAGKVSGGSPEQRYALRGAIELDWSAGLAFDLDLDASEQPVPLRAFASDLGIPFAAIEATLGDLGRRIGATWFRTLAVRVDTGSKAVAFEGAASLFGELLVEAAFSYAPETGLDFRAEVYAEPLALVDLLGVVGIDARGLDLPKLALGVQRIEFSQAERRLSLSGVIATMRGRAEAGLLVRLDDEGVAVSLWLASEDGQVITLADLIASSLPATFAASLPKGCFVERLGASGLSRFALDLSTIDRQLTVSAAGRVLGLEGALWFSLSELADEPSVALRVLGDPSAPSDLATLLAGIGVELGDVGLPRTKLALAELSFDQSTSSFRLAGLAVGGPSHAPYQLHGELELGWVDGVTLDLTLDASEKPVTLRALAHDLHIPFDSIDALPGIGGKIGATAFHSIGVHLDTGARTIAIDGAANLFGALLVSGSFRHSVDGGLAFAVEVYAEPLLPGPLLELLGVAGASELPLPALGVGLSQLAFVQAKRHLAIAGLVAIADKRAALALELSLRESEPGVAIRFSFTGEPDRTPSFIDFVEAVLPGVAVRELPLIGALDVTLDELVVTFDTHSKSVLGSAAGRLGLGSAELALWATNELEDDDGPEPPASSNAWVFTASTEPGQTISLQNLLATTFAGTDLALPDGPLPELCFSDLRLRLDTRKRELTLASRSRLTVPIELAGQTLEASLTLDIAASAGRSPTGKLIGELKYAGIDFTLSLELAKTSSFEARLSECSLHRLIGALLPKGTPMPDGVPDVIVEDLTLRVATDGSLHLHGELDGSKAPLSLGGASLTIASIELDLRRTTNTLECYVEVHGEGQLTNDVKCRGFELRFDYDQRGGSADWGLSGRLDAELFGDELTLAAESIKSGADRSFSLTATSQKTIAVEGVASLTLTRFGLSFARKAGQASSWTITASGDLSVSNPLGGAPLIQVTDGSVELFANGTERGLRLSASNARLPVELLRIDEQTWVGFELRFESFELVHAGGWRVAAKGGVGLRGVPAPFGALLAEEIEVRAELGSAGIELSASRLTQPQVIPLPELTIDDGPKLPLGSVKLDAENFEARIGRELSLRVTMVLGLPRGLNYIFGADRSQTPAKPTFELFETELKVRLSIASSGVELVPLSSPFKAIALRLDERDNSSWWDIDLGDAGAVTLMVPKFSFERGGFRATGGFDTLRPLAIPLTPCKALLRLCELDAIADALPDRIPLADLALLSEDDRLRVDVLLALLAPLFGSAGVPANVRDALQLLDRYFAKLPRQFRRYLNIEIPESFRFDIDYGTDSSFKLDVRVNDGDPPVRVLMPMFRGPLLCLQGVELYKISIGTLLAGNLWQVAATINFDEFDLLTLAGSLLVPDDGSLPLPNTADIHRRVIIENLWMLVIPQTQIPIPIPLLYDRLGVEYLGLEGTRFEANIGVRMSELDLMALANAARIFIEFVRDRTAPLPEHEPLGGLSLRAEIGNNYLKLPDYLGGQQIGYRGELIRLESDKLIAKLLNTLKFLRLDDLIQLAPLRYRVGDTEVAFGPFAGSSKWMITTPAEARAGAFASLGLTPGKVETFLTAVPKLEPGDEDEQGAMVFLDGVGSIGSIVEVTSTFGLAITPTSSVQAGLRLTANIGGFLDAEIAGRVAIGVPSPVAGATAIPRFATSMLSFDGADDSLSIAGHPDHALNEVTVEAWIRPERGGAFAPEFIVSRGVEDLELHIGRPQARQSIRFIPTKGVYVDTPEFCFALGQWVHVACLYRPGDGFARVYVDGREVHTITTGDPTTPLSDEGQAITVGARSDSSYPYDGAIAELRLWNRCLAGAELLAGLASRATGPLEGLVGCWPLDDGAGALARDTSSRANHARLRGASWRSKRPPDLPVSPDRVCAPQFDGSSARILIPHHPAHTVTSTTIELWFRWQGDGMNAPFLLSQAWEQLEIHLGAANEIRFVPTRSVYVDTPANTVVPGRWTHVACVYDPARRLAKIYVDGRDTLAKITGDPGTEIGTTAGPLRIGQRHGDGHLFAGEIADVRVWSFARSLADIRQDQRSQLTGSERGLVGCWPLDEGAGVVCRDLTANRSHGQLHGGWRQPVRLASSELAPQPPAVAESLFHLLGYAHLKLADHRIFRGDVEVSDRGFELAGVLTLFPKEVPFEVGGHVFGRLDSRGLILAGRVEASLGVIVLAEAHAMVVVQSEPQQRGIWLRGRLLGAGVDFELTETDGHVEATLEATLPLAEVKGKLAIDTRAREGKLDLAINVLGLGWMYVRGTNASKRGTLTIDYAEHRIFTGHSVSEGERLSLSGTFQLLPEGAPLNVIGTLAGEFGPDEFEVVGRLETVTLIRGVITGSGQARISNTGVVIDVAFLGIACAKVEVVHQGHDFVLTLGAMMGPLGLSSTLQIAKDGKRGRGILTAHAGPLRVDASLSIADEIANGDLELRFLDHVLSAQPFWLRSSEGRFEVGGTLELSIPCSRLTADWSGSLDQHRVELEGAGNLWTGIDIGPLRIGIVGSGKIRLLSHDRHPYAAGLTAGLNVSGVVGGVQLPGVMGMASFRMWKDRPCLMVAFLLAPFIWIPGLVGARHRLVIFADGYGSFYDGYWWDWGDDWPHDLRPELNTLPDLGPTDEITPMSIVELFAAVQEPGFAQMDGWDELRRARVQAAWGAHRVTFVKRSDEPDDGAYELVTRPSLASLPTDASPLRARISQATGELRVVLRGGDRPPTVSLELVDRNGAPSPDWEPITLPFDAASPDLLAELLARV